MVDLNLNKIVLYGAASVAVFFGVRSLQKKQADEHVLRVKEEATSAERRYIRIAEDFAEAMGVHRRFPSWWRSWSFENDDKVESLIRENHENLDVIAKYYRDVATYNRGLISDITTLLDQFNYNRIKKYL